MGVPRHLPLWNSVPTAIGARTRATVVVFLLRIIILRPLEVEVRVFASSLFALLSLARAAMAAPHGAPLAPHPPWTAVWRVVEWLE